MVIFRQILPCIWSALKGAIIKKEYEKQENVEKIPIATVPNYSPFTPGCIVSALKPVHKKCTCTEHAWVAITREMAPQTSLRKLVFFSLRECFFFHAQTSYWQVWDMSYFPGIGTHLGTQLRYI